MAQGDFKVFDDAVDDILNGLHDFGAHDIRLGLIDSTTPVRTTADPCWGAGGSTNYNALEVTETAGAYPAEGIVLTTEAVTGITDGAKFSSDNLSLAVNASNPPDVTFGILYNNSATNKDCIGYLDFGGATDTTNGLTITIAAGGWFDITSDGL